MKQRTSDKKIIRGFFLVCIWTLFVSLTVSGIIYAAARTKYIDEKAEITTVNADSIEQEIKELIRK